MKNKNFKNGLLYLAAIIIMVSSCSPKEKVIIKDGNETSCL